MIKFTLTYVPKYFTQKSIICFGFLLSLCFLFFAPNNLSIQWILFSLIEVFGFFYFANQLTRSWEKISIKQYQSRLFWTSFGVRVVWVFFSFLYYTLMTGVPFEFEAADATGYYFEAGWLASLIKGGRFDTYLNYIGTNYSDMGYPLYLGILWFIFGDSILIPRLIKAILSAATCVLIYKIARNNFGDPVGRIAGILSMLLPNLIYYCGLHVKETEMVLLVVLFAYYADKVINSKELHPIDVLLLFVSGASMFLFRTVLAISLIASLGLAIFLLSKRVSGRGRRIVLFIMILLVGIAIVSTPLGEIVYGYIEASDQNLTSQMDNFSQRESGNRLAKYGSRSIFLPFMLIAPFPTLVNTAQYNSMMLGGAFFTRNVYAFFVFIAIIVMYKRRLLRRYSLLLGLVTTYLFVLASSGFALSERFHLPIVPFLLILASYGISQMNLKNKKYYIPYLMLVMLIVIGWNWFKLAGRS